MSIAKIRADWSEGHLIFRDRATNAAIMTVKDGTDGIYFNQDMEVNPQYIKGQRFVVSTPRIATAQSFPVGVFIAPAPCKIISAQEFHEAPGTTNYITVLKQDGVLNSAQGTNCLASTFNVSSNQAAYTVQSMNATNSTGLSWLTTGERIGANANVLGTTPSGIFISVVLEWL